MNSVEETRHWLVEQLKPTFDVVEQELKAKEKECVFLFIKTLTNNQEIQLNFIKPFFEIQTTEDFISYLRSMPNGQEIESDEQVLKDLTKGSLAIFTKKEIFLFDVKEVKNNTILTAAVETTIQGPQMALSESVQINMNLIRHRYHQPNLTFEISEIGEKSKQNLVLIYDKDEVNSAVLERIKRELPQINRPIIQAAGELHRLFNGRRLALFPTMMITERPDRIIYNIAQGKVIILLDGNPFALMAPAVFFDFMSSMDDVYQSYWVSKFLKALRYLGLFISLILPGMYVGITSFNPEVFEPQLALSVAASRAGVPYPSYMEVLFMLIAMELLVEASIRLPKTISGTATTVGGLILGTAATEAALVSNIMIIIVAAVAISNFAIPINEMSFSMRVMKYVLLLIATLSGLVGLLLGLIGLIFYLVNQNSFGEPYLKIFWQKKEDETKGVSQ
ncbi:spore germination protein [Bacillus songklensis]|uniref:Spore germination protein n=1 Tax=Bacillus songklensis TaxID=1069116 RepID=A0ABV8B2Z1_9BACI